MRQRDIFSRRFFLAAEGGPLLAAMAVGAAGGSGICWPMDWLSRELRVSGFCAAQQPPPEPKKYALLVAVSRYEAGPMNAPQPLRFPEDDARAMAEALRPSGYATELLLGRQATQTKVHEALEKLAKQGNDEGIVLVGLFGHGVEYELKPNVLESFFCPYDVSMRLRNPSGPKVYSRNGEDLIEPDPDECVSMTKVFQSLAMSKAGRRCLIADCCRSDPHAPRAFGANIKTADLRDNTAALFACRSGQQAFEDPATQQGVFTAALLSAIRNHRGPGALTMNELGILVARDVERRVKQMNGKSQTPHPIVSGIVDLMIEPTAADRQPSAGRAKQPPEPQKERPPELLRAGQILTVRSVIGPGILSISDEGNEPAGKAMVFDVDESVVVLEDERAGGLHIANYTANGAGTRRGWLTNESITKYLQVPRRAASPTEMR